MGARFALWALQRKEQLKLHRLGLLQAPESSRAHFAAAWTCLAFDRLFQPLPQELKVKPEGAGLQRSQSWAYLPQFEVDGEVHDPSSTASPSRDWPV